MSSTLRADEQTNKLTKKHESVIKKERREGEAGEDSYQS
jgi:hypothetical protein